MTKEKSSKLWDLRQNEIRALYQEGNLEEALIVSEEAVNLAENAFGLNSWQIVSSLLNLAQIYFELDLLEDASEGLLGELIG